LGDRPWWIVEAGLARIWYRGGRSKSYRHRSGSWAELVEKMRQSLKLSGNNELTSPTGNLQGRRKKRSVEVAEKRAVCGSKILGMQLSGGQIPVRFMLCIDSAKLPSYIPNLQQSFRTVRLSEKLAVTKSNESVVD